MSVRTERRGRTLVVTIDREQRRNAVDQAVSEGLETALDELEDDPGLRCGVLTGAGGVFSAGTDLSAGYSPRTERGGSYGMIRRRRDKPLIAAVEGYALGGGFEIVLACDMAVAAADARFALPEVRRGVLPTCGGLFRGPRALPVNVAREMALTGAPLPAERLYALGLLSRVTEPGGALAAALELAELVNANAPVAVRESLRAMDRVLAAGDGEAWAATDDALAVVSASEDVREGVAAFLEKRDPVWRGR